MKKVAVLGSGVMGSAIAAHFANAGVPSLVLDIVPRELTDAEKARGLDLKDRRVRDRIARDSVMALAKTRPAPLFVPRRLDLIEIGNLEDDLARLAEADWVVEVVREEMGIKKKLLAAVAPHLNDHAILSSNTSGLSLGEMAGVLPESLRERFLGTHFFNPPRYMKLLELIRTPQTSDAIVDRITEFCGRRLGKGVVPAKDTPNFIANRIGVHAMLATLGAMRELGLTVEEIDLLTGPPMGRPKTATFRLADLVGLDTLLFVAQNVHGQVPQDESRDAFVPPDFLTQMVERGMLGLKSGGGFYKKVKKPKRKILTLDLETLEYREPRRPEFPELAELKSLADTRERLRALVTGDGPAAQAAWKILAPSLSYAAMRLGEIADDAATVDRAMKLGFNWELGPFETWDTLGFRETTERLRSDGYPLPEWVDALLEAGATTLYSQADGETRAPTSTPGGSVPIPRDPRVVDFEVLRRSDGEVRRNNSASLIDLGDGVLGLEFHSKMNAVDQEMVEMMLIAADEAEANWRAIVVANGGVNFSAGANLKMLAQHAVTGDSEAIGKIVSSFQQANDRLERCGVPVVCAPHGMALGGGCEVVLACNATHSAAEFYIGLVEVGAGLVPAGGGCLRLYKRQATSLPDPSDPYLALKQTFETIAMAKVSSSAEEARDLRFLRSSDDWSMHGDYRVADAKEIALAAAAAGYAPPSPERAIPVMGRAGVAMIEAMLFNMLEGRFISEHDRKIGRELALILSGGDIPGPTTVPERRMLELERESFLRLCGEPKTRQRITALLETGKPLRN